MSLKNINLKITFEQHLQLCEDVLHCIKEENSLLRTYRKVPGGEFLQRRTELLVHLGTSLSCMESAAASGAPVGVDLVRKLHARVAQVIDAIQVNDMLLTSCCDNGGRRGRAPVTMNAGRPVCGVRENRTPLCKGKADS